MSDRSLGTSTALSSCNRLVARRKRLPGHATDCTVRRMPNFTLSIRMQTHMLAKSLDDPRFASMPATFMRDAAGLPCLPHPCWRRAINDALRASGMLLRMDGFHVRPGFHGACSMYSRSCRTADGAPAVKVHEAVAPGERVVFNGNASPCTPVVALYDVIAYMGENVGLSPFGFAQGFGRFVIEDLLYQEDIKNAETTQESCRPVGRTSGTSAAHTEDRGQKGL